MGTAVEERRAVWLSRVNEWRASGLSRAAFARRQGLPVKRLNEWARRLSVSSEASTLVPVRLEADSVKPSLQLQSVTGWTLTLPSDAPATWLSELLRGLA
jgi:hypothetical protein